jgi:TamB, inner membrane protein subunit of TAM complex
LYYSFFLLAILFVLAAATIRFSPFVQTKIAQKFSEIASQKMGYNIKIGSAKLTWLSSISLGDLQIDNPRGAPMIKMNRLDIDFELANLQDSTNLNIGFVRLIKPTIHYEIDSLTGNQNIDEFIKKINELTAPKTPKKRKGRGQLFTIDNAEVVDGIFIYADRQSKPNVEKNRFDETHFTIEKLNAKVKNFLAIRDTVSLFAEIDGVDKKTGLVIKKLKTDFLICNKSMVFSDLFAHFGNTVIKNYLRFDYHSQKDMSDFFTKVKMKANLDSSYFAKNDIQKFISSINYNDNWYVSGRFDGRVVDFTLDKARIHFGKNSRLIGSFKFTGLPNFNKLKMNLIFANSKVQIADLKPYLNEATIKSIESLGYVNMDGSFEGTTNNFKTKGEIETALGNATTDLSMVLNNNTSESEYTGSLILNSFKVGEFFGDKKILKNISLNGKIKGVGLNAKDAVLDVDGTVDNLDYNGYNYQNLDIKGKLQRQLFEGKLSVKDSNLIFTMKGIVDLRENRENFNLTGDLKRLNLKKLKISEQDISLSTNLNVSFSGTNIDNIFGFARFNDFNFRINDRNLLMDTLYVYSEKKNDIRDFILDSDLIRLKLNGNYMPSVAINDLRQLFEEYKAYFTNNQYDREKYYANKYADKSKNYSIDYSINILESKPLLAFVFPDGYISNYTPLEGTFTMGNTVMLNMIGKTDTLRFGEYAFYNSDFDINTSKFVNNPEVLASGIINSEKQKFSILAPTEKLSFEGAWDKNKIVFNSYIQQQNSTNRADLNGNIVFTEFGLDLQFKNSKFKLLNNDWKINSENNVSITPDELCFKYMTIENKNQILAINGSFSTDSLETLRIGATNFELETIAPLLDVKIAGKLDGEASINDITGNMAIEGKLKIDSLVYKNLWIGNLTGESRWDKSDKLLNLNYYIDRENARMLNLEGIYIPEYKENSLDMVATLNQTNLKVVEPFTEGLFSEFEGLASGQVHITGTPLAPNLEGEITIDKGKIKVDYLNAFINFEDKIAFGNNKIITDKLQLTDSEGHSGTLNGGVEFEDGFGNIRLNLNGRLNNFKILNTTAKNNELFYGTAYATGNMAITGPLNNIIIKANATTNKGTKIYIPLDGAASISNSNFIEYITSFDELVTDTLAINSKKAVSKNSNIAMDFNFNVTPDAYCELQLDRQSGDLIKAYGNADLNFKVNTQGDFSLNGIYELDKGEYSFNFQTLITKQFKILPKSKIIWTGDPMEANLDIKAEYTQYTSLSPILSVENKANTDTRRFPVSVILNLKDRMLMPKVTYDIDFKEYPKTSEFNNSILAFRNKINTNEQELGRQVGSLLLTQRLIESSSDAFNVDMFASNIGEYLSNQVSKLASSENFQFGINSIDFSTLNQNLINSMQLQFSYNFDDRIRISHSRNGLTGNSTQNNNYGNLIGDWSLEWLITKDGRLRLKGYNRNTPNVFQNTALNSNITSYGASLVYTKSFNAFFNSKKKKVGLINEEVVMKMP